MYDNSWRNERYDHPEQWPDIQSIQPPETQALILRMLSRDPANRPTAKEVKTFFDAQIQPKETPKLPVQPQWKTSTPQAQKATLQPTIQTSKWVTRKPVEQKNANVNLGSQRSLNTMNDKSPTEATSDSLANAFLGLDPSQSLDKLTPALGLVIKTEDLIGKDGVPGPLQKALAKIKDEKDPAKAEMMMSELLQFCEKIAKQCFSTEQKNQFKQNKTFTGDEAKLYQHIEEIRDYANTGYKNNSLFRIASKQISLAYSDTVKATNIPIQPKEGYTDFHQTLDKIVSNPKASESDGLANKMVKDLRTQFSTLFANVDSREYSSWMAKNKEQLSPNLFKLVRTGAILSKDIKENIFFDAKGKERPLKEVRRAVAFYADVADKCVKDGNLAGAQAINAALTSSAVYKAISEGGQLDPNLGDSTIQKLKGLDAVFKKSEKRKEIMENSTVPIPFIGNSLTTLNSINDENSKPSASKPKLIELSGKIISDLQGMQRKQPKSSSPSFETDLITRRHAMSEKDYEARDRIYNERAQKLKPTY